MIIIKLNGGLGNQMFQFALYQAFKEKGVSVKLDRSKYSCFDEKRKCILDYPCFNLDYELCTRNEVRQYIVGTGMFARIFIKIFGDRKTHYFEKMEYEYDSNVLQLQDGYLDGFWQTWKYMEGIQDGVNRNFTFVGQLPSKAVEYERKIEQANSVAVHVRRGDYIKLKNIYGNICTESYYKKAIDKIAQLVDRPVFFFFSDDMEWTKATFDLKDNYVFVDGRGLWQDYDDMRLMSECKHQIIANSSFSWWAAWLNQNKDKKIVCPTQWVQSKIVTGIYCKEFIKV